jgi:transcriptional regulator with XRE-family HTH domain
MAKRFKKKKPPRHGKRHARMTAADEILSKKPLVQQIDDKWWTLAPDGSKDKGPFDTREAAEEAALKQALEASRSSLTEAIQTPPDAKDQHVHTISQLDEEGNGTTSEAGDPPHTHEIKAGEVQPADGSEHPGDLVDTEMGEAATALGTAIGRMIDEKVDDSTTRAEVIERVAQTAGLESNTLNEIINGTIKVPPMERLARIARALDVKLETLQRLIPSGAMQDEDIAKGNESSLMPYRRSGESRFAESGPQDAEGHVWKCVLIEEGMSLNGRNYSRETIRDTFERKIFENSPAFAFVYRTEDGLILDHAKDGVDTTRFPKDVAGFHQNLALEETSPGKMGIVSYFKFVDDLLRRKALEAWKSGNKNLFGFSIDAIGEGEELTADTVDIKYIVRANSDDLVSHPAAGGRFLRMVASAAKGSKKLLKEDGTMDKKKLLLQLIMEVKPSLLEGKDTDALTLEALQEMVKGEEFAAVRKAFAEIVGSPAAAPPASTPPASQDVDVAALVNEGIKRGLAPVLAKEHARAVEAAIKEAGFSDQKEAVELVRDLAVKQPNDEAHLKACVGRAQKLLEAGGWKDPKIVNVQVGDGPRERHTRAIEGAMVGRPIKGIAPFKSVRHMIESMTGMRNLESSDILAIANACLGNVIARWKDFRRGEGKTRNLETYNRRLNESGRKRFSIKEAIDLAQLTTIFGDSITRQMIADYNLPEMNDWRAITSKIGFVDSTRVERRERLGYYGGPLTSRAEGTDYTPIASLTDEEVTINMAKSGNFELITEEALLRNDLQWFAKIAPRLNMTALQDIRKAVWDLLLLNGNIYDGNPLFDAGNHANTSAITLSVTNLNTARVAMRKQTTYGSTRHELGSGNLPKFLVVPPELENTANQISASQFEPSSNLFQVSNLHRGIKVIVVDHETDVDRFYTVADPANTPTIEVDFVGNTDAPEMWTQDDPTQGEPFDSDQIKIKVRNWFGAAVIDWRGFYLGSP